MALKFIEVVLHQFRYLWELQKYIY